MALATEPVVFARDNDNDLIIPLRKAIGIEATMILVRTKLMLWRGEYYLNRDEGTEWIETADGTIGERDAILGQAYNPARVQRLVRRRILEVPDTVDISEFRTSFDGTDGTLTISCIVKTRFGEADLALEIGT